MVHSRNIFSLSLIEKQIAYLCFAFLPASVAREKRKNTQQK